MNQADHAERPTWWKRRGPVPRKADVPRCGATTRAGHPCKAPAWRVKSISGAHFRVRNGRCRMHGGLSTGPRSPAGKARCKAAALVNLERGRVALARKRGGGVLPVDLAQLEAQRAAILRLLSARAFTPAEPRAADAAEYTAANAISDAGAWWE